MVQLIARGLLVSLVFSTGCLAGSSDDSHTQVVSDSNENAIVDGTPARAYPEIVAIETYRDGKSSGLCSGTLIGPRAVLTAAHCTSISQYSADGTRTLRDDSFQIFAPYANAQRVWAHRAIVHPDYAAPEVGYNSLNVHDVAILVLDSPIPLPKYPRLADKPLTRSTQAVSLGRMFNDDTSETDVFVSKPFSIFSPTEFPSITEYYVAPIVTNKGDSGGPLMLLHKEHEIVGITAFSDDEVEFMNYTRVDRVYPWLQSELAALDSPTQ